MSDVSNSADWPRLADKRRHSLLSATLDQSTQLEAGATLLCKGRTSPPWNSWKNIKTVHQRNNCSYVEQSCKCLLSHPKCNPAVLGSNTEHKVHITASTVVPPDATLMSMPPTVQIGPGWLTKEGTPFCPLLWISLHSWRQEQLSFAREEQVQHGTHGRISKLSTKRETIAAT